MGTLNKGWQWHVTLKSSDSAQCPIEADESFTESVEGVKCKVRFPLLQSMEVTLSVLWVPTHVSDCLIKELIDSFAGNKGRVAYCYRESFRTKGFQYQTTRFVARIQDCWPEGIPKRMTVQVCRENFLVFILVKGRRRSCFLCHEFGHDQNECLNPYCRFAESVAMLLGCAPRKPSWIRRGRRKRISIISQKAKTITGASSPCMLSSVFILDTVKLYLDIVKFCALSFIG
jgi:hypothetical protein